MRILFTALIALVAMPSYGMEKEVFAGTGSFGEASFSDQPMKGHQPVTIQVTQANASVSDGQRIANELEALAYELAQSRRSREEARATAARKQVEPVVVERYYSESVRNYYPAVRYPAHNPVHEGPVIEPPPPIPPRKAFEPAFRPYRPANH